MQPARADAPERTDAAGPVIGHVRPEPGSLANWIDRWCEHRAARAKPAGVAAYRKFVESVVRATGWQEPGDLTHDSIVSYCDGKKVAGDWSARTSNHHVSIIHDFLRFLLHRDAITRDPIADYRGMPEESGIGARAATLDEARAFVAHTLTRERLDRRRKYGCAVYRALEFACGLRVGEAWKWRWRHLRLDEPVPFIEWTPEIQKNRRHEQTALSPEAHRLLLMHREAMRLMARESPTVRTIARRGRHKGTTLRGIDPANADDFVFPYRPASSTFRKDARAAGIAAKDGRGAIFASHSARKFYRTTLRRLDVHPDLIHRLLRHAPTVSALYDDSSLAEQAQALKGFPAVWPGDDPRKIEPDSSPTPLRPDTGDVKVSSGDTRTPQFDSHPPAGLCSSASVTNVPQQQRPADRFESLPGRVDHPQQSGRVESPRQSNQVMGLTRLIIEVDSNAAADLLNAMANLLREQERGRGKSERDAGQGGAGTQAEI